MGDWCYMYVPTSTDNVVHVLAGRDWWHLQGVYHLHISGAGNLQAVSGNLRTDPGGYRPLTHSHAPHLGEWPLLANLEVVCCLQAGA